MPNDLDDFLKRAASLRQQKAIEQRVAAEEENERQARSRPRPYSNRKRERQSNLEQSDVEDPWDVDDVHEAPILVAEVLDPLAAAAEAATRKGRSYASESRDYDRETREYDRGRRDSDTNEFTKRGSVAETRAPSAKDMLSGASIRQMLSQPGGLRQAFLLKEILNRPNY